MYTIIAVYSIALVVTPIIRLTRDIIMPTIIQYMIRLMIGLMIGNGRASVKSIDARYYISISIILIRENILSTHSICIDPLGIVITCVRYASNIYLVRLI